MGRGAESKKSRNLFSEISHLPGLDSEIPFSESGSFSIHYLSPST